MIDDPIVREIRAYRDELAKRFDYDVERLFEYIKQRQEVGRQQGRQYVTLPPRPVRQHGIADSQSAGHHELATR